MPKFLLLRWYYRLFTWCRFLVQVARLELNLAPLHPDRCGIGFLGNVASAALPLAPLLLTMFSAEELLSRLPGVLF